MQRHMANNLLFDDACNDDHAAIDSPEQGGCACSQHVVTAAVLLALEWVCNNLGDLHNSSLC